VVNGTPIAYLPDVWNIPLNIMII